MNASFDTISSRRKFLGGMAAGSALLALPACTTMGGFSFTEAIRRMLMLSSERAFARLTADGGFWDQQVTQIGLSNFLGTRGDVLSRILTSALFKDRLNAALSDVAIEASYRAAPVVADTVRTIGFQNAIDLVRGGPTAATDYLRANMADSLIEVMVPEVGNALRVARDPLVGQVVSAAVGTDITRIANNVSTGIDRAIWNEIGFEETAIRRNPRDTNDPVIIGVFGTAGY